MQVRVTIRHDVDDDQPDPAPEVGNALRDKCLTFVSLLLVTRTDQFNYTDNVRPVVPRGLPKAATALLWMRGRYIFYTKFKTSIVGITSRR